jgi:hypothetical protein
MSVSTAIIVNLALAAGALAALALVCRVPFRLGVERDPRTTAARRPQRTGERQTA